VSYPVLHVSETSDRKHTAVGSVRILLYARHARNLANISLAQFANRRTKGDPEHLQELICGEKEAISVHLLVLSVVMFAGLV
jgi:hypothetical protein